MNQDESPIEYERLRRRLDRYPSGAPRAPEILDILRIIFTPEEAKIGAEMPMKPATAAELARRTGREPADMERLLDAMADKGQVVDFLHEPSGQRFFFLSPTIVGVFEFSMMKEQDGMDQEALARLYQTYWIQGDVFLNDIHREKTHYTRIGVHETALPQGTGPEVLDMERASMHIEEASSIGISPCACRHIARLQGRECKSSAVEMCLTLNYVADYAIRHGLGRKMEKSEARELLLRSRETGLVQTIDNVRRIPTFMCHCCSCCCELMTSARHLGTRNTFMTSNWLAAVAEDLCVGCGSCARRCPVDAIEIIGLDTDSKAKHAQINKDICLGCGVCVSACKKNAVSMTPRKQRVVTPADFLEKLLLQAIERGKLQNLLFDDDSRWDHRFLRTLTSAVLNLPPVHAALVSDMVKSRFLAFALKSARKQIVMPG